MNNTENNVLYLKIIKYVKVKLKNYSTLLIFLYHYSKYFLFEKKSDVTELRKIGYKIIKPYIILNWRFGNNAENFKRRYYLAKKNNRIYFIKIASHVDKTLSNEICVYNYLRQFENNNGFKIEFYSNDFKKHYNLLSINYVDSLKNLNECNNIELLLKKLNDLLDELYYRKIIHADITSGNLKLNLDNDLVLFDFGITCIDQVQAQINYSVHCGTYYKSANGYNIYDDAYSIKCILDLMSVDKSLPGYIEIENKIGRYDIKIKI